MKQPSHMLASSPVHQSGAALLISLVILLVLTTLALSSMQGTSTQEKMVSSQRDAQVALDGAEAALLAAEAELRGGTLPTFDTSEGLYDETDTQPAAVLAPGTWAAPTGGGHGNGTRQAPMPEDSSGDDLLAEAPRYFIKATPATGSASSSGFGLGAGRVGDGVASSSSSGKVYRVVAFSSGASGQAARAVEAYVIRAQ
ncbi:PilX N-terminal domain-containing pilus assembly protein [uncultured Marinobacter sp.]|uniref:pilus assembly PilX family protein n=1 Tax=uncultured Marinobacter sp. TaxID=187379 RepID=UPI002612A9DC|nr:PilX N-terminal domain-containing pilus assembly protein [uncultured Marinobacter sp.]